MAVNLGFKVRETTCGIFGRFPSEDAMRIRLEGGISVALASVGPDLRAKTPEIRPRRDRRGQIA